MPKLSPALLLASQLAEYEAVKSRQDHIEPEHVAVAVLSLDKVFDPAVQWQFQISDATLAEVRSEWEPVQTALVAQGAEPSTLRRTVRQSLRSQIPAASGKMAFPAPSPATEQILARATSIAQAMATDRVRIEHFIVAFFGEPIPRVQELVHTLKLDPAALRAALMQLKTVSGNPRATASATQPLASQPAAPAPSPTGSSAVQPPAAVTPAAQPPTGLRTPAPAPVKPLAVATAPVELSRATATVEPAGTAPAMPAAFQPPVAKRIETTPAPTGKPQRAPEQPEERDEQVSMARTQVLKAVDATSSLPPVVHAVEGPLQRLACLWEMPAQVEKEQRVEAFLQRFLRGVMGGMPQATRGAILMRGGHEDDFLLKAHYPIGEPAVNLAAARQAMQTKKAFISRSHDGQGSEDSAAYGLYAPLVWKGETLGVLCLDGGVRRECFDSDDLNLLMTFAQHAALSIVNFRLQEENRRNTALVERLLTNFSPKIRERLLERARRGRLQLGGDRSEVTVLFSDIRNFTNITADLETEDVMDMLNECFSASAESIFKFSGTIDKFVGDSVLAVFGSPDPDPQQHVNALRAALSMQQSMAEVNRKRSARGRALCQIGIGVHCGEVLHGFVGAAERIEFTVIGDAVNRAARFCAAAGAGEVLISGELYQRVWRTVEASQTTIPTKHEGPLTAYRIRAFKEEPSPAKTA